MKKVFTFFLFVSVFFSLKAQEYYISFQPQSGSPAIDTTWVINQSTNQKVKLIGGETLFLAKNTVPVTSIQSGTREACLWPNPSNGEVSVDFSTEVSEPVTSNLYDASGQLLSTMKQDLSPGWHRYKVHFPTAGVYYLSVVKSSGALNFKAISTGGRKQESQIAYEGDAISGVNHTNGILKNAVLQKTMNFTLGNLLFYSCYSGRNNTVMTDSPGMTKVYTVEFTPCIDQDNQSYPVVKIGTQKWMAGNLQATKYRDGTAIPLVKEAISWYAQTSGAYCWYNNNESSYRKIYGALYNWYAASDSRNICPSGWHVPSDTEWTTLEKYLIANLYNFDGTTIENNIGKSLAAITNWDVSTTRGAVGNTDYPAIRNKSGFTALPGGGRAANGAFDINGSWGLWWTSTTSTTTDAWARFLGYSEISLDRFTDPKKVGYSIRCIKD